jgi:hypothetical protein
MYGLQLHTLICAPKADRPGFRLAIGPLRCAYPLARMATVADHAEIPLPFTDSDAPGCDPAVDEGVAGSLTRSSQSIRLLARLREAHVARIASAIDYSRRTQ